MREIFPHGNFLIYQNPIMNRIKLIKKAAEWAETKQGLSNIKANHRQFEMPKRFHNPMLGNPIIPDVSGLKEGGKFYVEVATKTDFFSKRVSKWQLLSKLAQIKGGKLLLLAPVGHRAFVKRILEDYSLNAKMVEWNAAIK